MEYVEVSSYDAAAAGIVTRRVPLSQVQIGQIGTGEKITVSRYDAAAAGLVTRQIPVEVK